MSFFYTKIARPLLFQLTADRAHQLAMVALRVVSGWRIARKLLGVIYSYQDPILETEVTGLKFRNPLGLAAGFDPNANAAAVYGNLGFGGATVGSVTRQAQVGNPRPHFTRLIEEQSLIVNKGLRNAGAARVAKTVMGRRKQGGIDYPLGISIARTTAIPEEQTAADYAASYRELAPRADYIEVNVSCPNVAVFSPEKQVLYIQDILREINKVRRQMGKQAVPLWLKLGPDLDKDSDKKIIDICRKQQVDAIILTNLSKERSSLRQPVGGWPGPGGVSGKLLAPRAEAKLKFFYQQLKGEIALVSVGGIFTAEDAYRRIQSGANMMQLLTGWIYGGPATLRTINKGLARLLKRDGFRNIQEAIGILTN